MGPILLFSVTPPARFNVIENPRTGASEVKGSVTEVQKPARITGFRSQSVLWEVLFFCPTVFDCLRFTISLAWVGLFAH